MYVRAWFSVSMSFCIILWFFTRLYSDADDSNPLTTTTPTAPRVDISAGTEVVQPRSEEPQPPPPPPQLPSPVLEVTGRDGDVSGGTWSAAEYRSTSVTPPKKVPNPVYQMSQYGIACTQTSSCQFYKDVLLIIKVNPVRMLWLDLLLRFYSTGFPNIVFWSALKPLDPSLKKTYVGAHRMTVHLMDDNQGFCDHHTVAVSMKWFPNFTGYIYLSDDVLFMFWQTIGFDKSKVWRQTTELRYVDVANPEMDPKMVRALKELRLENVFPNHRLPFASTSGLYYVPRTVFGEFYRVSAFLLSLRTYNEWGTPFVLQSVDNRNFISISGKLVWKHRRLQVRQMFSFDRVWLHPVRASAELFARLVHLVFSQPNLQRGYTQDNNEFWGKCFVCATNPKTQRKAKGLYHSCRYAKDQKMCASRDIAEYAKKEFPEYRHSHNVGGRVFVPQDLKEIPNGLELAHEGFWNPNISRYMYNEYLPLLNRTTQHHPSLVPYPSCCVYSSQHP